MFPFTLTNNLKIVPANDSLIKERIIQSISQSLPNKTGLKVNAIVVIEADGDSKRTICINETLNTTNNIQITTNFPINTTINNNNISTTANPISTNVTNTNSSGLIISQPPLFPATFEDLQALFQLTNTLNRNNGTTEANQTPNSIVPNANNMINLITSTLNQSTVKSEPNNRLTNMTNNSIAQLSDLNNETSSRKRKAEKPIRIPQEIQIDPTNGLDLSMNVSSNNNDTNYNNNNNNINSFNSHLWPSQLNMFHNNTNTNNNNNNSMKISSNGQQLVPVKPKRNSVTTHKKSSKIFNCNQCKLQFTSLNSLCKHTFSDHRAFRCTFCGANFTQRSNLQRHSLKHVGFKPFICNVCNKSYYRKDHLVRHIEVSHPGCDPKMNITVKLSSSECLEYLEKIQSEKLRELDANNNLNNNTNNLPNSSNHLTETIEAIIKSEAEMLSKENNKNNHNTKPDITIPKFESSQMTNDESCNSISNLSNENQINSDKIESTLEDGNINEYKVKPEPLAQITPNPIEQTDTTNTFVDQTAINNQQMITNDHI